MYRSTMSVPSVYWKDEPPTPDPPKEDGNWVLIGAPTSIEKGGYFYLVWTWMELDAAISQGVSVGTALAGAESVYKCSATSHVFASDAKEGDPCQCEKTTYV